MAESFIDTYMEIKENLTLLGKSDCGSFEFYLMGDEKIIAVDRVEETFQSISREKDPEGFKSVMKEFGFNIH